MSRKRYWFNEQTQTFEEYPGRREVPARLQIVTDSHYADLRATDGTPIDSRTKHRNYMKANNLALADDFKSHWADKPNRDARQDREQSKERKNEIAESIHKLEHNPRSKNYG